MHHSNSMDHDGHLNGGDNAYVHNGLNVSTAMEQPEHLSHDNFSPTEHWGVDLGSYNPMGISRYGSGDFYVPPVTHGLPSESIGGHMSQPPMQQPQMHHQQHHQQHQHPQQHTYTHHIPHPIVIPTQQQQPPSQVSWPSLRTNPSQNYSAPPMAMAQSSIPPAQTTTPAPITPAPTPRQQQQRLPSITTTQPRKTLTHEDRRRMCLYHEENPHVKQTDIGLKFGVERSTVSKTLRQKDRWLSPEDRGGSPIQRSKGKTPPDIERALANWVRGMQKKGTIPNDAEMVEQAKIFCGVSEGQPKAITHVWIEKFKQKHGVGPGRLIRRASETAIPDSKRLDTNSPLIPSSQASGVVSPTSPIPQPSSPLVVSASADSKESVFGDFKGSGYRNAHSQSTTSLSSAVTDPASSTFSNNAFSPTSNITFSPDGNTGMFGEQGAMGANGNSNFHRPRSQTFPNHDQLEYINQGPNGEQVTPKLNTSGTAPSSALESPIHEISSNPFGIDSAISPPSLRHVSSSGSLAGRSSASGIVPSTPLGGSCPTSPTQADAHRAADTLLKFMANIPSNLVDQGDLDTILRLTQKLGLQVQQSATPKIHQGPPVMGGLSRIPEGDTEMHIAPDTSTKTLMELQTRKPVAAQHLLYGYV